jgi:hypothetical protein
MKKRPTDFSQRALAVVEEATAESAETADELYRLFWEETGIVAPTQEIHPPLLDEWGEDERWQRWREWITARKRGDDTKPKQGRAGGLVGGKARAEKLSAEERSEIARKAATARWSDQQTRVD